MGVDPADGESAGALAAGCAVGACPFPCAGAGVPAVVRGGSRRSPAVDVRARVVVAPARCGPASAGRPWSPRSTATAVRPPPATSAAATTLAAVPADMPAPSQPPRPPARAPPPIAAAPPPPAAAPAPAPTPEPAPPAPAPASPPAAVSAASSVRSRRAAVGSTGSTTANPLRWSFTRCAKPAQSAHTVRWRRRVRRLRMPPLPDATCLRISLHAASCAWRHPARPVRAWKTSALTLAVSHPSTRATSACAMSSSSASTRAVRCSAGRRPRSPSSSRSSARCSTSSDSPAVDCSISSTGCSRRARSSVRQRLRAIVYSHGRSRRSRGRRARSPKAEANVSWTASSASSGDPSTCRHSDSTPRW